MTLLCRLQLSSQAELVGIQLRDRLAGVEELGETRPGRGGGRLSQTSSRTGTGHDCIHSRARASLWFSGSLRSFTACALNHKKP